MQHKLNNLIEQLSQGLVQREDIIKTALLTLIAGENLLLIGPPGTAKSLLARRIAEALIEESDPNNHLFFEYLLTKFSTPEEIFGSLSLTELKKDNFHRKTAGYLPTAQVGFLDEIFKASSSILNTLLTILNERRFHNGRQVENVHLQTLIGASNELPNEQAELSALYDRFLLRKYVGYVDSRNLNLLFDLPPKSDIQKEDKLTTEELNNLREQAKSIQFPDEVRQAIEQIWAKHKETFKEDSDEYLSDRRFIKLLHILRVSAVTNGRDEVDFSDVLLLKDALWNNANNAEKVVELVKAVLQQFDETITLDSNDSMPSSNTETFANPAPEGSVIKGLKGSGTESDPFLIENVQNLIRLTDKEVGLKGYYFKQTADIDCSQLTTWHSITFKGIYDGSNYLITHESQNNLFNSILLSEVKNIKLKDFSLSDECNQSTITNCSTNCHLLVSIENSSIRYCHSVSHIATDVNSSSIQFCEANSYLVKNSITDSKISDCLIDFKDDLDTNTLNSIEFLNKHKNNKTELLGAVTTSSNNSTIKRVFITGNINTTKNTFLAGLAVDCENSHIKSCVLGKAHIHNYSSLVSSMIIVNNNNTLEKNIYTDTYEDILKQNKVVLQTIASRLNKKQAPSTNTITRNHINASGWGWSALNNMNNNLQNSNNHDTTYYGDPVSESALTQSYLENHLDWNFDTIWQWDTNKGIPVLQPISHSTSHQKNKKMADNQVSLLAYQLKNNIWL